MIEYKSPFPYLLNKHSIFLAGSIEMGKAEDWQSYVKKKLSNEDVILLNPRRERWDPTWDQSHKNTKFKQQVVWELDAMDDADLILFYFDPKTKSPITLLELGLHAKFGNVVVCCPTGYWRKGNVEIVCQRYGIPLFETLDELLYDQFLISK